MTSTPQMNGNLYMQNSSKHVVWLKDY